MLRGLQEGVCCRVEWSMKTGWICVLHIVYPLERVCFVEEGLGQVCSGGGLTEDWHNLAVAFCLPPCRYSLFVVIICWVLDVFLCFWCD